MWHLQGGWGRPGWLNGSPLCRTLTEGDCFLPSSLTFPFINHVVIVVAVATTVPKVEPPKNPGFCFCANQKKIKIATSADGCWAASSSFILRGYNVSAPSRHSTHHRSECLQVGSQQGMMSCFFVLFFIVKAFLELHFVLKSTETL